MTTKIAGTDNLEYDLVGEGTQSPFNGYISDTDKTTLLPQTLVEGSQNVRKTLAGTIAPRQGKKVYDPLDTSNDGVVASFDWYDSLGNQLPIRVLASGKLAVLSSALDGVSLVWYTILTGLTKTRFIFDTWWDQINQKDILLGVNGTSSEFSWSGGLAFFESVSAPTAGSIWQIRYPASSSTSGTYSVNDVLTLLGGVGGTVLVTAVSGGVPIGLELLTIGSGYSVANGVGTTGGGGSGMTLDIVEVRTTYSVTKTGTSTFAEVGFLLDTQTPVTSIAFGPQGVNTTDNRIMIGGVEYAYFAGLESTTLTGVGGYAGEANPTGTTANSFMYQSVIEHTDLISSTYVIDMLKVVNNQVVNASYSSRVVYASNSSDYTLIGNGASLPGYQYILTLDENVKALAVRQGNLQISSGLSDWYEISVTNVAISNSSTVQNYTQINVLKKIAAELTAALGQEFVATIGDDIVYLGQDHQIYVYGSFTDQFTNRFPTLSQEVRTELAQTDFTGGQLVATADELNVVAPLTGKVFIYNSRQNVNAAGQIISERFWDPPQILNISRIAILNGQKYGYAVDHPQLYQLSNTNQYHDDSSEGVVAGYTAIMRSAYRNHGRRQGLVSPTSNYTEGYMLVNTNLYGRIRYDYLGATGIEEFEVSTAEQNAVLYRPDEARIIGSSIVGTREIGGAIPEFDYNAIPKFRVTNTLTEPNCFEYQTEYYSVDADSNWQILCFGTNATLSDQQAVEINRLAV